MQGILENNRKSVLMVQDEQNTDSDTKRSMKHIPEYNHMNSYPFMLNSENKAKSEFLKVHTPNYLRSRSQKGDGIDYETIEENENENRKLFLTLLKHGILNYL